MDPLTLDEAIRMLGAAGTTAAELESRERIAPCA